MAVAINNSSNLVCVSLDLDDTNANAHTLNSGSAIPAGTYSWIADGTLGLTADMGMNLGGELASASSEMVTSNTQNIYTLTYNAGEIRLQRTTPTGGPTLTATDPAPAHNINNLFVSSSLDRFAEWEICGLGKFIKFLLYTRVIQ